MSRVPCAPLLLNDAMESRGTSCMKREGGGEPARSCSGRYSVWTRMDLYSSFSLGCDLLSWESVEDG